MQVQERFVLTEMHLKVKEGERRVKVEAARRHARPSLRTRTLLTSLVHRLGL